MSRARDFADLAGSADAGGLTGRNLIINGAMQVAQRGTSSTSAGFQTVDRFQTSASTDATITQSQTALTSGSPYDEGFRDVYRQTVTTASSSPAAGHYLGVVHNIEASTIDTSGWKHTSDSSYLTLSFWVKSSVAGTYVFQFRTNDGTAQAYTFEYTLVADTWKKVTHSIPGNSSITVNNDNGRGLELYWWLYLGTTYDDSSHTNEVWEAYSSVSQSKVFAQNWMTTASATFDVTGVQLEVGEQATPFEHRSFGDEYQRCLRYYYRTPAPNGGLAANENFPCFGNMDGSQTGAYIFKFPVAMRAAPTAIEQSGTASDYSIRVTSDANGTSVPSASGFTAESALVNLVSSGAGFTSGDAAFMRAESTDAFIAFSSEL